MIRNTSKLSILVLGCGLAWNPARADVVTEWNDVVLEAVIAAREHQPAQARAVAMVHAAVFEAINAVERRYASYVTNGPRVLAASPDAAAATTAHAVLSKLYPAQRTALDKAYAASLARVPEGDAKTSAIALGERVARNIYDTRQNEMTARTNTYKPRTAPGVYVPTTLPVATDAAAFKPWLMQSPGQFRPPPPVALKSARWAQDYNEMKEMGAKDSVKRSAEQTDVGRFWIVTGPPAWNPVIRAFAATKSRSVIENARLFALAHMAGADAYIAVFDAKYTYNFWRPITAIRNGDIDGNPATSPDSAWAPLIDTPMHPEYPCAHCITAAAVATVLEAEFGRGPIGPITMTSPTAPGVKRTWSTVQDYLTDVNNARIWGGVHYRFSTEVGEAVGRKIGELAVRKHMLLATQ